MQSTAASTEQWIAPASSPNVAGSGKLGGRCSARQGSGATQPPADLTQPAPEVPEPAGATRPDRCAERDDAASARVVTHGANRSGRDQARS